MVEGFNEFYIEAGIPVTGEQIKQREKGIANFCKELNCNDICELVRIYYGLNYHKDFYDYFIRCYSEIDPNFSAKYVEEIKLLAGAALVYIVEHQYDLGYLTELLVVTMSFYHSNAIGLINTRILKQFNEDRIALRTPQEIKSDFETLIKSLDIKYQEDNEWQADLFKLLQEEHKYNNELLSTLQVYKEDSQILWWMNSKWCNTLNCEIKSITKKQACIIVGYEAAEMVENYPGPFSISAVLKNTISVSKGTSSKISIDDVLSNTDPSYKKKLISKFANSTSIDLVPIHAAICREANTTAVEQWYPKYEQEILHGNKFPSCTPDEYSFRMFLESLALKLYAKLSNKGGK